MQGNVTNYDKIQILPVPDMKGMDAMKSLDDIPIGEIRKLKESLPQKATIGEALPILRAFRDKYELSDKDALKAYTIELGG